MGSRFQFQLMTEAEAREILGAGNYQLESHADRIRAQRVLNERVSPCGSPRPSTQVSELRARIKPEGPWFVVPAMTTVFQCRTCRADAFWITTQAGERMLVDCDVDGGKRPNRAEDGKGVAHYATCPEADQWRKK